MTTAPISRPVRPRLIIPDRTKNVECDFESSGVPSPDITRQLCSPPASPVVSSEPTAQRIGKYVLVELISKGRNYQAYRALHEDTAREVICKVVAMEKYRDIMQAYWAVGDHEHISGVQEVILGRTKAYLVFERHYGDLHTYMRGKRRVKEAEARHLFKQVASAVRHCHERGVVLRDLKLGKAVFADPQRTIVKLEGLEDACVFDEDSERGDQLSDKYCCPAYASPEMLSEASYSGRAADLWSLGVMLYTLLLGRFPFNDPDPVPLLRKIRRGVYTVPDTVSSPARCLIRCLLRREPHLRLNVEDILRHPWFSRQDTLAPSGHGSAALPGQKSSTSEGDQAVPGSVTACLAGASSRHIRSRPSDLDDVTVLS